MSYRFIAGPSGSGKTKHSIEYLLNKLNSKSGQSFFYIVPEQFTLETQKSLVKYCNSHSVMDIDILSFNRLAFRVLRSLGKDHFNVLEDMGKSLILRKLAEDNKHRLRILSKNIGKMSYINELKSIISELMQYQVYPSLLKESLGAEGLSNLLSGKIEDISLLYEKFLSYIKNSYVTDETVLDLLWENIGNSKLLKDSVIVFDGFTGFTPIQEKIVKRLLEYANELIFTVTIQADSANFISIREDELFFMSKEYISNIRRYAGDIHIKEEEMVILRGERRPCNCKIYEVDVPREELILAAENIRDIVINKGLRYKDIAILCGDIDIYKPYIEEIFSQYDIPVFIDESRDLGFHSLVSLLKNIQSILVYNFKNEDMISFIKNSLISLDCEDIKNSLDYLENYLIATGIRGEKSYRKEFIYHPGNICDNELSEINIIKNKILNPILTFYKNYGNTKKKYLLRDMNMGIYYLLQEYDIERILFDRNEENIYSLFIDVLEKADVLLGDRGLYFKEYIDILISGICSGKLVSLPKSVDMVVFGDTVRTRLDNIHTLFVLGANEGILPNTTGTGGILTQRERQVMENVGIKLSPGERQRQFAGDFYIYLMKTRASSDLFVSYSRVSSGGDSLRPSFILKDIKREYNVDVNEYEYIINTGKRLEDTGSRILNNIRLLSNFRLSSKEESILSAYFYIFNDRYTYVKNEVFRKKEDSRLNKDVILKLNNNIINSTTSRIETYSKCAYGYFLNYILGLKEKAVYGINPMDTGNIYHDSLYNFFALLRSRALDICDLGLESRNILIKEAVNLSYTQFASRGDYNSKFFEYTRDKIEDTVKKNIEALLRQILKSSFKPRDFEIELRDMPGRNFLDNGDIKISLNGKIDRIDIMEIENSSYIKVVDYKSGNSQFDYSKLFYGLQIQLLFYLYAKAKSLKIEKPDSDIIPAAFFYYHIDDPINEIQGITDKEAADKLLNDRLRPTGLILNDDKVLQGLDVDMANDGAYKSDVIRVRRKKDGAFDNYSQVIGKDDLDYLMNFVEEKIYNTASDISKGIISKNPFRLGNNTGCEFCKFHSICGFDVNAGDSYREISVIKNMEEFRRKNEI